MLLCLGALVFALGAYNSWVTRDALAPGGGESRGAEAVVRFLKDFSEWLFISIGFWTAGWYLLRRRF